MNTCRVVDDNVYCGSDVPDGTFDSLSNLKAPPTTASESCAFSSTVQDCEVILKICQSCLKIPPISARQATEILYGVRADVNDFYSITANHFVNAGRAGFTHFYCILSTLAKIVTISS